MARYSDSLSDELTEAPIAGAKVYVFDQTGAAASLTDDGGIALSNPLTTDTFGGYFFNTTAGFYTLDYHYGGRLLYQRQGVPVGSAYDAETSAMRAEAAEAGAEEFAEDAEASDTSAQAAASQASLYAAASLAAAAGRFFDTIAEGVSNGVVATASLVGGTGGTNGTFALGFSGGGGTGAAGQFVVSGGVVTQVILTAPGKNYTSAPAISFAASSGLTGASATSVIAVRTPDGEDYLVRGSGDTYASLYKNIAGTGTAQGLDIASLEALQEALGAAQPALVKVTGPIEIYNPVAIQPSTVVVASTGAFTSFSGFYTTPMMAVIPGGSLIFDQSATGVGAGYGIAFYGSDDPASYISGLSPAVAANTPYSVPAGATRAAATFPNSVPPASIHAYPQATLPATAVEFGFTSSLEARRISSELQRAWQPVWGLPITAGATQGAAIGQDGTVIAEPSYFYTGDLPCIPGVPIYFDRTNTSGNEAYFGIRWKTLDGTYISGTGGPLTAGAPFTPPAGAYKFQFTGRMVNLDMYVGTAMPPAGWTGEGPYVPALAKARPWVGKTVVGDGDSIISLTRSGNFWFTPTCRQIGAGTQVDWAVAGSKMQDVATRRSTGDYVGKDLYVISTGTNDVFAGTPLGVIGDTKLSATFAGYTRAAIEKAQNANHDLSIALLTPIQRGDIANASMLPYVDMIRTISADYGVPVLDCFRTSGFNSITLPDWTDDGYLHPNAKGGARRIRDTVDFLESIGRAV